tara:strand:- start:3943 stop:4116 length:174 start_codon:yes stop_codon:yes gene_type:complete
METIFGIVCVITAGFFCYISFVCVEEEKTGKRVPLFWEKDFKLFNKSDVKYRDGDNT